VTAAERKSITDQLYTIQSLLDDLLDQIAIEPKPKPPAKTSAKIKAPSRR
jgi:hypothetical protein